MCSSGLGTESSARESASGGGRSGERRSGIWVEQRGEKRLGNPELLMTTPISIEDVRREVKILKALSNHNNLVKFYDACEDALNVYVVMELCEGGELLERILSRGGRYSEEDAKAIVIQILSVIAFCHLQGVVHRDLKSEALSKALTEDQLFYLRSQFKLLAPNGEGHISFDNFRMALLQNATEAMKESKVIDILNVARRPFLLPFFFAVAKFLLYASTITITTEFICCSFDLFEYSYKLKLEPLLYRKMDFEEFCAAVISPHHLEALDGWEQMTSTTFEHFKREGNRAITVKELAQ
ncbi:hypothetical protein ZIOFF_070570 [Zingiber officinale]|uniref:Uncharacterized protein n=1 Tax=Zingiber officinale TaxID=94328 RepID=A0A8J5BZ69_ZINOF|nr:hypothetical protein ZIOFF_070570 [Zingiber officinale]